MRGVMKSRQMEEPQGYKTSRPERGLGKPCATPTQSALVTRPAAAGHSSLYLGQLDIEGIDFLSSDVAQYQRRIIRRQSGPEVG